MSRNTTFLALALLTYATHVHARGRCTPETRCRNSPDGGLSESSEFLPPENATAAQLQTFLAGMQYAVNGTSRCLYGHEDLAGAVLSMADTRSCPKGDGYCGWVIDYFDCTCAPRERALAAYDASGYWAAFGVFLGFGLFTVVYWIMITMRDLENGRWSGDGDFGPGFDCSQEGVCSFWFIIFIAFGCPTGMLVAAFWNLHLALRDVELAQGYWMGCGSQNWGNPVHTSGVILYSVCGSFFAFPFLMAIICLVYSNYCESESASSRRRALSGADSDLSTGSTGPARGYLNRRERARAGVQQVVELSSPVGLKSQRRRQQGTGT